MSAMSDDRDDSDAVPAAATTRRCSAGCSRYLRPYRWLTRARRRCCSWPQSGLALVGPRLTQHALDVAMPQHDVGLLGLLAGSVPGDAAARLRGGVRRHAAHHLHRPAGHVRPADGDLRPPAAAQHQLLRPEPGRPADDPGHLRRRDAERAVLLGRGHRLRRRVHAARDHGDDAGRSTGGSRW